MTAPAPPPRPPTRTTLPWIPIGIAGVVVVLTVGVMLWVVVTFVTTGFGDDREDGGSDEIRRFENGPGALLVPRTAGDDQPDMVGVLTTYDDDGDRTQVVRSSFAGDVRWRSRIEVDGRDRLVTVLGDVAVLDVEGGDEVVALDLGDGAEAWRATLPIDPTCGDCLQLVGDALVGWDLDRNLTAVDPRTGAELWSRPGDGLGDAITPVVSEASLVVSDGADLVVVDPADGAELQRLTPSCPPVDDVADEQDLTAGAFVEPIPSSGDVAVVFGHEGRCVQRWDTATGEQEWGVAIDVGYSGLGATVSDRHIAFSAPSAAVVVDADDGSHVELPTAPEHAAAPLAIVEGEVLLAEQVPDLGTTGSPSLLGWDLDDDEVRWSLPGSVPRPFVLPEQLRPGGIGVIGGSAATLLVPGDDGLALVSVGPLADGEAPVLRTATVDLATGELGDEHSVRLTHDPERLDPALFSVNGVADGRVAVIAGAIPQLVDIATGEVVAAWPVPD